MILSVKTNVMKGSDKPQPLTDAFFHLNENKRNIFVLFSTDHTHMFSHENAYYLINAFSSTTLKRLKTLMERKYITRFLLSVLKILHFRNCFRKSLLSSALLGVLVLLWMTAENASKRIGLQFGL